MLTVLSVLLGGQLSPDGTLVWKAVIYGSSGHRRELEGSCARLLLGCCALRVPVGSPLGQVFEQKW